MRNLLLALTFFTLLAQVSCGPTYVAQGPAPAPAPPPPAPEESYQSFYDALSPYGEWINNPDYGYVWMPNVGPDFHPYATNGNWVYTDEGWAWESNYAWGWAPFHYGRWFFEDGYGWMWIPGNEWAPAWVSWRESPDYYGWAPLGPSISVNVAIGGGYNPPPHYWCFVPHQYVTSPHLNNYYVGERENVTIINRTTVIRNTTIINNNTTVINNNHRGGYNRNNYAGGPDPNEVSRFTGSPLRPVTVRETNTPGGNRAEGSFAVFRPRINTSVQGNNGGSRPTPTHLQTLNNVHPVNTTIYNRGNGNNTTINNTTINNNTTNNASNNNSNNNNSINGNTTNNGNSNNTFQPRQQPVNPATGRPWPQAGNQPANQQQPANQPAFQPAAQPGSQPGNQSRFQPGGQRFQQPSQPAGQQPNPPANPPHFQPGNQPATQAQPGNRPAPPPSNTRFVPPLPATSNGNPAVTPAAPRPATGASPGQRFRQTTAGNGNNQPGQQRVNGNPPKPQSQQGQNGQDRRRKPDPATPPKQP
jgi:hypothetical protein